MPTLNMCAACFQPLNAAQEIADLRAQIDMLTTTVDRLNDANRVLARELDEARRVH